VLAIRRVVVYIGQLTHGAGTWRAQTTVPIEDVVSGGKLYVTDVDAAMRYVQLYRGNRLVTTLAYSHQTYRVYTLDRAF
jgi:hypothetical protein